MKWESAFDPRLVDWAGVWNNEEIRHELAVKIVKNLAEADERYQYLLDLPDMRERRQFVNLYSWLESLAASKLPPLLLQQRYSPRSQHATGGPPDDPDAPEEENGGEDTFGPPSISASTLTNLEATYGV